MNNKEKFKILIVDDERSNIVALNYILKPAYSTLVATDGQAALDIVKETMPDLILLDILMPDVTGFEVLAELKRDEFTRKIPVIIISGLDSTEDEETGFFLGAVDYITKPFRNSIVRARVKTHLQMVSYIREIEHFGMTDPLTGMPNRRSFDERINMEWQRAGRKKEPISILMIDIDKFKDYNDTYGHAQGDVFLQTIAQNFMRTLKQESVFAARWGGEEFVVLLPETSLGKAMQIGEYIRSNAENISIPCPNGTLSTVTISIGVASEVPVDSREILDFISDADKALYKAKNLGRNIVCS